MMKTSCYKTIISILDHKYYNVYTSYCGQGRILHFFVECNIAIIIILFTGTFVM